MTLVHESIALGEWKQSIQLGGLRLVEAVYRPGVRLAPHAHDRANVSIVLAGYLDERTNEQQVRATSTSFVLKPSHTVHANAYGSRPVRSFLIEIEPGREAEVGIKKGMNAHWNSGGADGTALLEVFGAFRSRADDLEQRTLAAVRQLVGRMTHQPSKQSASQTPLGVKARATLAKAIVLLRENLTPPLRSRELAARVGVHPVYLARLFRAVLGSDISGFRRRLAVREAARRLADTKEGLSAVAQATGFSDQSHLGRATRKELGMSPGAFRSLVAAD